MGVSIVGGVPKFAGWFISWKIPSFEMDDEQGYPHFRKPPYPLFKNNLLSAAL